MCSKTAWFTEKLIVPAIMVVWGTQTAALCVTISCNRIPLHFESLIKYQLALQQASYFPLPKSPCTPVNLDFPVCLEWQKILSEKFTNNLAAWRVQLKVTAGLVCITKGINTIKRNLVPRLWNNQLNSSLNSLLRAKFDTLESIRHASMSIILNQFLRLKLHFAGDFPITHRLIVTG